MSVKRFIKLSWSKKSKRDEKEMSMKGELIINNYRETFLLLVLVIILIGFGIYFYLKN